MLCFPPVLALHLFLCLAVSYPSSGAGIEVLPKDRLTGPALEGLLWRGASEGTIEVVGESIELHDLGGSLEVFENERRATTIRKLPSTFAIKRKIGGRLTKYMLAVRRNASSRLEIASCVGSPVKSRRGESWVVDADLDGTLLEPDEDALLLHDSSGAVTFTGEVWHLDRRWELAAGELSAVESEDEPGEAGLRFLNHSRQLAGLGTVRRDEERSRGASLHAAYVAKNWGTPFNHHSEDPSNRWYTEEGARAAENSLFGYCLFTEDLPFAYAIQSNLDIVYHRRALLDPSLIAVGFGTAADKSPPGGVPEQIVCLDMGGKNDAPWKGPLVWPADGQLDVPCEFTGLELPMPLPGGVDPYSRGYPVTLIFPPFAEIESAELELTPLEKKKPAEKIEGFCFGPGREVTKTGSTYDYALEGNSNICHFISATPLGKNFWYEAVGRWRAGGVDHEHRWVFRTGKAPLTEFR